ncbi:MAG: PBP1A family penicillin-binding protein [Alphaproteobacteria bacterium]|nr:PBP1A family penicillin-binding protein [Alphaproteobacteria bacterium]
MTRRSPKPGVRRRAARRRRAAQPSLFWRLTKFLFVLGSVAFVGLAIWVALIARDLPDVSSLGDVERTASLSFYDQNARLIARRGSAHGRAASVDELPDYLIDAVLAVEDRRFYSHYGIDLIGMGRALLANLRAGRVVQGGSTLTQQLAKNLFLSPERTLERKVQEVLLAFWLESRFSKDEILELYLNRVYFGGGAWGVEAASMRYFGRSASEVSLGEAALLAGLLKAPSRYSPVSDAERAAARATVVLDLMEQTGRISPAERIEAAATPIRVSRGASSPGAQYFIDWIAPRVRELAGPGHGDLRITTTLDVDAQRAAERAVSDVLSDPDLARGAGEAALVSLAHDGAVRAMVGGQDYLRSQYNRAILAQRQPGSAFKPFVYASAFEAGLRPDDVRSDSPVQVGDWSPANYNGQYRGDMTLREAFARSSNAVAVRIAEETGRSHIARLAERLGIESRLLVDRSLALGAYEVNPLEMAVAYAAFANGGRRAESYGILLIETADGEILYEAQPVAGDVVLDTRTYAQMQSLFRSVIVWGTGRQAAVSGIEIGGKTGTTNDFRDAWFAGFGGELVTAIWTGNDDNAPTERATGGGPPAAIFSRFMADAPSSGLGAEPVSATLEAYGLAPLTANNTIDANPDVSVDTPAETADEEAEEEDPIAAFLSSLGGNEQR